MDDEGNITVKETTHVVTYDNGEIQHFPQYDYYTFHNILLHTNNHNMVVRSEGVIRTGGSIYAVTVFYSNDVNLIIFSYVNVDNRFANPDSRYGNFINCVLVRNLNQVNNVFCIVTYTCFFSNLLFGELLVSKNKAIFKVQISS